MPPWYGVAAVIAAVCTWAWVALKLTRDDAPIVARPKILAACIGVLAGAVWPITATIAIGLLAGHYLDERHPS